MSQELVKINATITGKLETICSRCGNSVDLTLDETVELLVSDGVYNSDDDTEIDVVEIYDGILDFNDVLNSELESIKSDYHICTECMGDSQMLEKEF